MFLNPLLLFGALAISVPILIHLLNRRKFQRVRWGAMKFLQASIQKNRRRMRLEDWLLLALRCLIVAVLALALARPTMRQATAVFGRPPVTAIILLDRSFSMGKTDGTQTRFGRAKLAADEVIAGLPQGSSAGLILFSDAVEDVIPQPTSDLALVREEVRQAKLSDRGTSVLAGLTRAQAALAAVPGANKEIVLITDGQAGGWRQGAGEGGDVVRLLEEMKGRIGARVVLVEDDDARNLAVSAVRLTTELPTVNKVLRFEVQVHNHGNAEARDVPVRLHIDDSPSPVEEAVIDAIPARGSRSISLHARLRTHGHHGITARIAADALPADDARSVVVNALKQVQVLLVNGEAGREGREEDVFFVREAMHPVPVDLRPGYFIQTRTIAAAELPATSLDSYDAVVLANVPTLTAPTVAAIDKFVQNGRGLIVFPGPAVSTSFYNETLYRQRGILPSALGEAVGDSNQGERFETLQSTRFTHPIMSLWNDEGRGNPAVAHFFRVIELRIDPGAPAGKAGRTAVVANYADGRPAIVERPFGEGRVILFGSTANTQWNDLPVRASIFIPLMHRVLDSIVERQDEHLAIQVGQRFAMRTTSEVVGRDALISGMKIPGQADPPPAESVRVELQDGGPRLAFDATDRAGLYKVAIDGADEPTLFAVQTDPAESDLTALSPAEQTQINAFAPVLAWKPGLGRTPTALADAGRELWWPLAAGLLAVAALESLLAFWFSRVK